MKSPMRMPCSAILLRSAIDCSTHQGRLLVDIGLAATTGVSVAPEAYFRCFCVLDLCTSAMDDKPWFRSQGRRGFGSAREPTGRIDGGMPDPHDRLAKTASFIRSHGSRPRQAARREVKSCLERQRELNGRA